MNFPAEDTDQARRCRRLGLLSLFLGVLSTPLAVTIAALAANNSLPEKTKETLGMALLSAVIVTILVVQIASLVYIRRRAARGRRLAVIGIIATGAWPVLVAIWLYLAFIVFPPEHFP